MGEPNSSSGGGTTTKEEEEELMAKPTPGVEIRHAPDCPAKAKPVDGHRPPCRCKTAARGWVYLTAEKRKVRSDWFTGKGAIAAAKAWRTDRAAAKEKGTLREPEKTTLREYGDDWLEKIKRGEVLSRNHQPYKPSAIRGYRHDLETHIYPRLGDVRLDQVRRRDIQAIVEQLTASGLSGSKVRNVVVPLQALYRRAMRDELVTVNPTVDLDLPAAGGTRDRVASVPEALALVEALDEEDRALWATAFFAGLRRGELRGLRDEDVDLERNTIYVRRGWDDVKGAIDPKSKRGERKVPVAGILRRYLLAHRARTGRRGVALFFGRTATEPFTPSHVRRTANERWSTATLNPIGLHEARHTYVSLMYASGSKLEEIGDYVGHSSTYMTSRYRHLIDGQGQEAADRFDGYVQAQLGAALRRGPVLGQSGQNSGGFERF
jgi:integrase